MLLPVRLPLVRLFPACPQPLPHPLQSPDAPTLLLSVNQTQVVRSEDPESELQHYGSSVCFFGPSLARTLNFTKGFDWRDEGKLGKPKVGYVATAPGSVLVLGPFDVSHVHGAAIGFLTSYDGYVWGCPGEWPVSVCVLRRWGPRVHPPLTSIWNFWGPQGWGGLTPEGILLWSHGKVTPCCIARHPPYHLSQSLWQILCCPEPSA